MPEGVIYTRFFPALCNSAVNSFSPFPNPFLLFVLCVLCGESWIPMLLT